MLVPFFMKKQLVTRSDVPPIPQKVTFGLICPVEMPSGLLPAFCRRRFLICSQASLNDTASFLEVIMGFMNSYKRLDNLCRDMMG